MKSQHARLALVVALLMAGCAIQPATNAPTPASNDPLGLGDAVAPKYQTLSTHMMPVAIANVATSSAVADVKASASSDRNPAFFAVSNLTDGNLHSAWGPAANDLNPTVTLDLAQATSITGLGIKMDAGATFDVAVSNGGAFTTIATNVTPQARTLDFINLPSTSATQVRLKFNVGPDAQLLVCEVQLFTGNSSPSLAPSVAPSNIPSNAPSPPPSEIPSPTPSASSQPIVSPTPPPTPLPSASASPTLPNPFQSCALFFADTTAKTFPVPESLGLREFELRVNAQSAANGNPTGTLIMLDNGQQIGHGAVTGLSFNADNNVLTLSGSVTGGVPFIAPSFQSSRFFIQAHAGGFMNVFNGTSAKFDSANLIVVTPLGQRLTFNLDPRLIDLLPNPDCR